MTKKLHHIPLWIFFAYIFPLHEFNPAKQFSNHDVVVEISRDDKGDFVWYYKEKLKIDHVIKLPKLENGFDSLEVRAYYTYKKQYRMLVINYSMEKWSAVSYAVNYQHIVKDSSMITIQNRQEAVPKNGWNNFIHSFRNINLSVIHPPKIHKNENCFDGSGITVEIATRDSYKILHYSCPSEDKMTKSLHQLMGLLEKEFE